MKKLFQPRLIIILICVGAISILTYFLFFNKGNQPLPKFDAERAYNAARYQVNLGPRLPGSQAHAQTIDWLKDELQKAGWQVEIQSGQMLGHPLKNIIAKRGTKNPWIILGAHFDSRQKADNDPIILNRSQPVPGANDGASGVAVLLEIARVLPSNLSKQVWIVFFDLEDQGNIPGWDWILGSRFFASNLQGTPDAVVIIDMIGDADLNIYYEANSTELLTQTIWNQAHSLGYRDQFIPQIKHQILDDHIPFIQKGIAAIDIIDIDYPYWHTVSDTLDKITPDSLRAIGDTLLSWLIVP